MKRKTKGIWTKKGLSNNTKVDFGATRITVSSESLKAHCRGTDWINKAIKKNRVRQGSVISLYSEIHEDDNGLIPFYPQNKV